MSNVTANRDPLTETANPGVQRTDIACENTVAVQSRCRARLCTEAREIDRLTAQIMRLRAVVILRESELAWAGEDRAALEHAIPGLPRRIALARRVDALLARIQDLMRERATGRSVNRESHASDERTRRELGASRAKPPRKRDSI